MIPEIAFYILYGLLGALTRILVQVYRDKKITQTELELGAELSLGAIAGWVAYQLLILFDKAHPLAAWALGYAFPDAVENLVAHYNPKPE